MLYVITVTKNHKHFTIIKDVIVCIFKEVMYYAIQLFKMM